MGRFEDCVNHPAVSLCLRIFRWFPVVFIVAVICWSYYAYVVELCISTVHNVPEKLAYLIPYHVILFIFLWAYWQTTMSALGTPPKHFKIPPAVFEQMQQSTTSGQREILERLGKDLPIYMRTFDGAVRFCEKCKVVKPDRAHHCSICGVCVLKMDHHCPWVNTCVHYSNYKYFVQFLGYALLYCIFIFVTDVKYFVWFWTDGIKVEGGSKFHIMFLFFVSGMFGISVSTLFFYHLWLTSKNRSTLEGFRAPVFRSGPDKDGFNLGCKKNFGEVFGGSVLLALLPVFTSYGDGSTYPVSSTLLENNSRDRHITTLPPVSSTNLRIEKETADQSPPLQPQPKPPPLSPPPRNLNTTLTATAAAPPSQNVPLSSFENGRPGDGVSYPVRTYDTDEDGLLHHHHHNHHSQGERRWPDDEESASDYENEKRGGSGDRSQQETSLPMTFVGIHA